MKECSFPPVGERCLSSIELCKRAKRWQICENEHEENLKLNKEKKNMKQASRNVLLRQVAANRLFELCDGGK